MTLLKDNISSSTETAKLKENRSVLKASIWKQLCVCSSYRVFVSQALRECDVNHLPVIFVTTCAESRHCSKHSKCSVCAQSRQCCGTPVSSYCYVLKPDFFKHLNQAAYVLKPDIAGSIRASS